METTASARFGLHRRLPELHFADARERVIEALSKQGFGIITEIDLQATFKKKLGVDFRPYVILGACNPRLAYDGISKEPDLGLLLPCNVVVTEHEEGGSVVSAMDPYVLVKITDNLELEDIAGEARRKLKQAMASL